jgi:hypothetical protein
MAGLESATYIDDLVSTNPDGSLDKVSQGDDHIRLIKAVLKAQFPNLGAAPVDATADELTGAAVANVANTYSADRLYVRNGTPSDNSVRVTADSMLVTNAAGGAARLATVDVTGSLVGGTGLNKLDTGVEAPSTWYYVYVVWDGTTAGALLSLASDAPTAPPSGYTFWCRVGAIYNDSGSDLVEFDQRGSLVNLTARDTVLSAGTATSATLVDLTNSVPVTADAAILELRVLDPSTDTSKLLIHTRSTGGSTAAAMVRNPGGVTSSLNAMAEVAIATQQTIGYNVAGSTPTGRISVTGGRY